MNKTVITVIVVVAVAAVGGFLVFGGNTTPETGDTNTEQVDGSASQALVASAFAGNASVKCTYEDEAGTAGTVYVKEGKVRADSTVAGGTNSVLFLNDKLYSWGETEDGQEYGIVMNVSGDVPAGANGDVVTRAELESQLTAGAWGADCESYDAANSMFVVPTDVQFMSFDSFQMPR